MVPFRKWRSLGEGGAAPSDAKGTSTKTSPAYLKILEINPKRTNLVPKIVYIKGSGNMWVDSGQLFGGSWPLATLGHFLGASWTVLWRRLDRDAWLLASSQAV